MRKTAAIGLLLLLLFNLCGYRLFFHLAELRHDARLTVKLDSDRYAEEDLVELRVPLPLPYMNDQQEWERVNGEINVTGTVYKFVKRKVEGGTLVLKVLPDQGSMAMNAIRDSYFKITHEISDEEGGGKAVPAKSPVVKGFSAEFSDPLPDWALPGLGTERTHFLPHPARSLAEGISEQPPRPPEAMFHS